MKKIMFSDKFGLTQAVLDGRKTMTRRLAKLSEIDARYLYDEGWEVGGYVSQCLIETYAHFKVGEVVAIAQSYKDLGYHPTALDRSPKDWRIVRGTLGESKGWNNKMFVRADACKHRIRITNIRIERLQDISYDDILAEGISTFIDALTNTQYFTFENAPKDYFSHRTAFRTLIDKVSGKGTWESNPYVFAYEFELVK